MGSVCFCTNGQRTQRFGDFNTPVCNCCDLDFASNINMRQQLTTAQCWLSLQQCRMPTEIRKAAYLKLMKENTAIAQQNILPLFWHGDLWHRACVRGSDHTWLIGVGAWVPYKLVWGCDSKLLCKFLGNWGTMSSNLGHNLLGPLSKTMHPHCTGVQPWELSCPGFCVLRRKKRVECLCVEGKHCLTLYVGVEVWGDSLQGLEARRGFLNPWTTFIHASWQLHIMSELLKLLFPMSDRGQAPLLHCTDPHHSYCCRAQGTCPASGSFVLTGILALLHASA